jgi:hypothetical protein
MKKTKQKYNICGGHHYAKTNTNNINVIKVKFQNEENSNTKLFYSIVS